MKPSFRILKRTRAGDARLGILRTRHGIVRTPAYVIVATHAKVRTLSPADIRRTRTQLVIANTYHLWEESKKSEVRSKKSGTSSFLLHRLGLRIPTMTDSGGFQVFSLGAAKEHGVGKVLRQPARKTGAISNVRITERGVHFSVGVKKRFLSPETSIAAQERLGADIIFAFDECTSPLHPHGYTRRSMERTHRWARRCLRARTRPDQMLLGIIQGGRFRRLRAASATAIAAMGFDGFGIGGSFGKREMRSTLAAIVPHLPVGKPRHLLGIGTVPDIFDAVEAGIDMFDCVVPTREARHGKLYTDDGAVDIRRQAFASDRRRLLVSRRSFAHLHRLFRAHDRKAGRLATLHNVRWFNLLLEHIRAALSDGSYGTFRRDALRAYPVR